MLAYRGGRLLLDGLSAEGLVERFGSPLYVYSRKTLLERYRTLAGAFGARRPLICYALKANSNRSVCRVLAQAGAGADIVSGGELVRAVSAGFEPGRIVFSGVGKTEAEMRLALRRKVLTLNVESAGELDALEGVARRLRVPAPVSIRLNPDVDPRTHPHITTGRAHNKFGVSRGEALALYRKAARSPWLRVKGISCHIGSQILDPRPFAAAARSVTRLASDLLALGITLELLDFGGGFGVSYGDGPGLDVGAAARALLKAAAPWPKARLLLEPGRYLTADAGVLLTTVLYEKKTASRRFVIVDAGMNDLVRPALYGVSHPVAHAKNPGKGPGADIVGPVCESGDFLARGCRLPTTAPGDVLAVLKAGAYGFSMSSQYNSRPRPAEVLLEGGRARLARRRETVADLVRHER